MDFNELKALIVNTEFFFYNSYLGVVRGIEYDSRVDQFILYFYDNSDEKYISYTYMFNYYIDRLKIIRMLILKNRNIQNLVHFTPLSNLESILNNGFFSRNSLDFFGYNFSYTDEYRIDNKLDFICNSITFPNYKMFYSKRKDDPSCKWAILSIDSEILINKFDTEFYRFNASSSDESKCRFDPCSNYALEDMFYPEDRDSDLPSNYTTNPQAEVLIKNYIDKSYIKCIDTLEFDSNVNSLAKNFNVDYNPKSNLFTYRKDYKRW